MNVDFAYINLIKNVLSNNNIRQDRTMTGTVSIFGQMIDIDTVDFPIITCKEVHYKSVVIELLWFLLGRTDLKYLLDKKCFIWVGDAYKKYVKNNPDISVEDFTKKIINGELKEYNDLGPIYGKQWRDFNGVDQIKEVLLSLHNNPFSRRHLVNSWNPSEINKMTLPPCHYSFQFYVTEIYDKKYGLSLMFNMRSIDIGLGLPFNIASYATLLFFFCKILNMVPLDLKACFGDAHIYLNHVDKLKELSSRQFYYGTSLEIDYDFSDDPMENINNFDLILNNIDENTFKLVNYKNSGKLKLPLSN